MLFLIMKVPPTEFESHAIYSRELSESMTLMVRSLSSKARAVGRQLPDSVYSSLASIRLSNPWILTRKKPLFQKESGSA